MPSRKRATALSAFAGATALLLSVTSAAAHAASAPATPSGTLYVTSGSAGTLTGVNAETGAVRTKVALTEPRGVGITPLDLRTSRDGRIIYALCYGTGQTAPPLSGTLVAIDADSDQVLGTAPIGWNPTGFALSPDGADAYVTGPRGVDKVDLATMTVTAKLAEGYLPAGPQVSPDGSTLYVANNYGKDVDVIDTATLTVRASIPVASNLRTTALSKDGSELYVVDDMRRLTVLNTATDAITATVSVGPFMSVLTMSPDGTKLYVSGPGAGEIDVVKTANNKFNKKIPATAFDGVAFSPDGRSAYAVHDTVDNGSTVFTIDRATETVKSQLNLAGNYYSYALSPNGRQLWVAGSPGIAVIDTKSDSLLNTFDTPNTRGVAFSRNSAHAFVGEYIDNTIAVFDTATLRQRTTVAAEFRFPSAVTVSPDGTTAYVASSDTGSTIRVVDLATGKPTADISVGAVPSSLAATSDGAHVLATNDIDSTLSVISAVTDTVTATIPIPSGANEVRSSPDGKTAYVLGNTLTVVDLATSQVTGTIQLSGLKYAVGLVISADGSTAYVDGGTSIAVVDLATETVTRTLTAGTTLNEGMALSPDGSTLYVVGQRPSPQTGALFAVDLATGATTSTVAVGSYPYGVAVSSDGGTAYVTNDGANTVSVIDTATGSVTKTWKFGTGLLRSPIDGIFYRAG